MASRGANGPISANGTDGTDYLHRQTVASHYQTSAVNKSRLKFCIYMHYILFFVMLVKLFPDILDRLDIFFLEIEELYVPKPRYWEWIWTASVLTTIWGLKAVRKNNVNSIRVYAVTTFLTALCPVLYALYYYLNDIWEFIDTRSTENITDLWQGYPVALIWYAFLVTASQVHLFQLLFSWRLNKSWAVRRKRE